MITYTLDARIHTTPSVHGFHGPDKVAFVKLGGYMMLGVHAFTPNFAAIRIPRCCHSEEPSRVVQAGTCRSHMTLTKLCPAGSSR